VEVVVVDAAAVAQDAHLAGGLVVVLRRFRLEDRLEAADPFHVAVLVKQFFRQLFFRDRCKEKSFFYFLLFFNFCQTCVC
jgi:hypothetical protein